MGTSYVHRYTHVFLQIYNSNRYLTFYLSTPQQTTETNTANKYNTLDYYKWTDIDRTILKCSVRWATRTQSKLQIHWFWRTVFVNFFFLLARTRIICLIFQLHWICIPFCFTTNEIIQTDPDNSPICFLSQFFDLPNLPKQEHIHDHEKMSYALMAYIQWEIFLFRNFVLCILGIKLNFRRNFENEEGKKQKWVKERKNIILKLHGNN